MLFQQMEHILKCLLANGQYSGYASELKTNIKQRRAAIHKQPMGQVVGQFLENTFPGSKETTSAPEELKEIWFSFGCTIKCNAAYYEERKSGLASIVSERNDLIHHLLPKWDFNSLESSTTEQYLDCVLST